MFPSVSCFMKYFIIVSILLTGLLLRLNNYSTWPRHGATFDEFAWTWLGISLIQNRVPVSWSRHPQYENEEYVRYQGAAFRIVRPYLEHPPLFGLVAGGFALLNGADHMYDITLKNIRTLALILGISSTALLFFLSQALYGEKVAFVSALLYATVPTIVVGSRIVQNENFLIPFWLFSLYAVSRYLQTKKRTFRNIGIAVAALLPLAKVPWIAVPFSLFMIFMYHRKWKDALLTIIVTIMIFSFFIAYGIYYDSRLFFNLWLFQLARYDMSFVGLHALLTKPLLVDRYYLDGWIYFGLLSLFLLTQEYKKHIVLLFSFLSYFLVYIFVIPDEPGHGWYRYPFLPFLILSTAVLLKNYFGKNCFFTFLFLCVVGLSLFQLTWFTLFGFSHFVLRVIILSFSLTLLPLFFRSQKLFAGVRIMSYSLFFILILLNVWATSLYNEQ